MCDFPWPVFFSQDSQCFLRKLADSPSDGGGRTPICKDKGRFTPNTNKKLVNKSGRNEGKMHVCDGGPKDKQSSLSVGTNRFLKSLKLPREQNACHNFLFSFCQPWPRLFSPWRGRDRDENTPGTAFCFLSLVSRGCVPCCCFDLSLFCCY